MSTCIAREEEQSPLRRLWEGFLDFAAEVLENHEADQVAARIPFSGTIKDPETSLFATIASVLRNAFVSAFARSLEGSITLRDVKKNLNELDPRQEGQKRQRQTTKKDAQRQQAEQKPKPGPAARLIRSVHDLFDARAHVRKERITRGAHQRVRALEQGTPLAAQCLVAEMDTEVLAVGIGAVE